MKEYNVMVFTGFSECNDYVIKAPNKHYAINKALKKDDNEKHVTKLRVRELKPVTQTNYIALKQLNYALCAIVITLMIILLTTL